MKTVNADDLKKELSKAPVWTAIAVKEMIDEMTNTQVQCKECRYYHQLYGCQKHDDIDLVTSDDDFCSYGERKSDEQ